MTDQDHSVLFACGLNRVRSPMAAVLAQSLSGGRLRADSCGVSVDEDTLIDPFAWVVMDELGIDLIGHTPKAFEDLALGNYDVIVSLSPEAQTRARALALGHAANIEEWLTADPTLVAGSRETILEGYRGIRDGLAARIRARFPAFINS